MNLFLSSILFLQLLLLSPPVAVAAQQGCSSCHEATIAASDTRIYLHPPFAQRKCGSCHTAEEASAARSEQQAAVKQRSHPSRKKVSWLGDSVVAATRHSFVLPADRLGEFLVVEKKAGGSGLSRDEIAVPRLNTLAEVADSGQPPVISEVKVLKVERGVFLSVTIGWQTDSLSKSLVRYGEAVRSQRSEPSKRYGHEHRVTLYNLKPGKDYNYVVTVTDLFGRQQESAEYRFSTEKPLNDNSARVAADTARRSAGIPLNTRFRKLGAKYLVELTAPVPFLAFVGSAGKVRRPPSLVSGAAAAVQHPKLSSEQFRSTRSCQNCHAIRKSETHPVNVFPKSGMTIPPEYPTLPDGRITCASCHSTHGSDNEFLAIKAGKRELCVGCHKDML